MFPDGAFRTGDIGLMDERGYVKIVDRKKDMILVSGFNVYPNEVEDVVAMMPGVLEVCAVAAADDKSGEVVRLVDREEGPGAHPGGGARALQEAPHGLQAAEDRRVLEGAAEDQRGQGAAARGQERAAAGAPPSPQGARGPAPGRSAMRAAMRVDRELRVGADARREERAVVHREVREVVVAAALVDHGAAAASGPIGQPPITCALTTRACSGSIGKRRDRGLRLPPSSRAGAASSCSGITGLRARRELDLGHREVGAAHAVPAGTRRSGSRAPASRRRAAARGRRASRDGSRRAAAR